MGGVVSAAIPHAEVTSLALALVAVVAPLAVVAAYNPAYRIAPITAILVLLSPVGQHAGALESAVDRMLEIGLGCVVALAVALVVLPTHAHRLLVESAGAALKLMSEQIGKLLDVQITGSDAAPVSGSAPPCPAFHGKRRFRGGRGGARAYQPFDWSPRSMAGRQNIEPAAPRSVHYWAGNGRTFAGTAAPPTGRTPFAALLGRRGLPGCQRSCNRGTGAATAVRRSDTSARRLCCRDDRVAPRRPDARAGRRGDRADLRDVLYGWTAVFEFTGSRSLHARSGTSESISIGVTALASPHMNAGEKRLSSRGSAAAFPALRPLDRSICSCSRCR